MRNRIHELTWAFDDISEQITDIKTALKLYEERLRESAEEPRTQSILRGQLKQLELAEKIVNSSQNVLMNFYGIIFMEELKQRLKSDFTRTAKSYVLYIGC